MERRIGSRAQVDFPVRAFVDGFSHDCRAVDLSATGMVVERTRSLSQRFPPELAALELELLDEGLIPVRARTVWTRDRLHAVRFVLMHDVDRLSIAEHLDRLVRRRQMLH